MSSSPGRRMKIGHFARSFVQDQDLQNALSAPNDTMIFVKSIMDPYDCGAMSALCQQCHPLVATSSLRIGQSMRPTIRGYVRELEWSSRSHGENKGSSPLGSAS